MTTFGKIIAISLQALVNDDLGAFSTIPATAALNFEASRLVAKIEANRSCRTGWRCLTRPVMATPLPLP